MKRALEIILAATRHRPEQLQGIDAPAALAFYGWLFDVVMDLASPCERHVLEILAMAGECSTADLIRACGAGITPQQMGATLARLRRLGLVWTIRSHGEAYHDLDGWVRLGGAMWKRVTP